MKNTNSKLLAISLAALSLGGLSTPSTNANENNQNANVRSSEKQNTKPQTSAQAPTNIQARQIIPAYGLEGFKSHKDYNGGQLSRYKQQQKFKKYCKSKK